MSVNEKMTAIANEVRTLSGVSDKLGLDEMASHTKDANTEVDTQKDLIQQIAEALQGKAALGEAKPIIAPLEVTENGTYNAPDGVDGYSPVVVDVPVGGLDTELEDSLVMRTIATYSNNRVKTIGTRAFSHCASLVSVYLPEVTTLGQQGFNSCTNLKRIELPKLTNIVQGDNLTYCYALEYVDFGFASKIPSWCVANDKMLTTLILRKNDSICALSATNALSATPIEKGTGYVYVPRALVDTYKAATNWTTYANQIRAIEDYPEITGG